MKIAQAMAADAWGGIDEKSLERGIGGREGAMIRLAKEWAKQGHEVTNYVTTKKPVRIYEGEGFYEFVPFQMVQTCMATFPYDACIAWECPNVYANEKVVARNPVRLVEMQCAHMSLWDTETASAFATGVVGLSDWHVGFMEHQGIEGPFYVVPNGVDLEHYPYRERKGLPRKKQFIYSSSPDRGLIHLLRLWPHIRARWPEAELKIAYGVKRWLAAAMWAHIRPGQVAVDMYALLRQPGITDVGQISQRELAKIQCESTIMAYPCDTSVPTETGCISAIEAGAAGIPLVTTDCDCMEEEFGDSAWIASLPFDPNFYMESLITVLEDKKVYTDLSRLGREFAETRQWKDIASRYLEVIESQPRS